MMASKVLRKKDDCIIRELGKLVWEGFLVFLIEEQVELYFCNHKHTNSFKPHIKLLSVYESIVLFIYFAKEIPCLKYLRHNVVFPDLHKLY